MSRTRIGEMFVDRNGKTSGKRVAGMIGVLAALAMAFMQISQSCDAEDRMDNTGLIISIFTASVALLASSMGEKDKNVNKKNKV